VTAGVKLQVGDLERIAFQSCHRRGAG
jgi:hypothetical protein